MDDDIRDRFRGVSRREPAPTSYGRAPARISRPAPAQQPIDKSSWPSSTPPTQASAPAPQSVAPSKPPKPPKRKKSKKKRSKQKKLLWLIVLIVLLAIVSGVVYTFRKGDKKDQQFQQELTTPQDSAQTTPKLTGTIRFIAVGDSLAYESINNA